MTDSRSLNKINQLPRPTTHSTPRPPPRPYLQYPTNFKLAFISAPPLGPAVPARRSSSVPTSEDEFVFGGGAAWTFEFVEVLGFETRDGAHCFVGEYAMGDFVYLGSIRNGKVAVKCEYLLDVKWYPMMRVNTQNFKDD